MPPPASPSLRRLAGALLALAVVPALAFAAAQVFVQSESEVRLAQIRDDQLDGMLFSVNQNAWDVTSSWADRIVRLDLPAPAGKAGRPVHRTAPAADAFFEATPAVRDIVVADTSLRSVDLYQPAMSLSEDTAAALRDAIGPALVRQLAAQSASGYRKLEPVTVGDDLALVFVDGAAAAPLVYAAVVAARPFVESVVTPKLHEVASGGVALGVFAGGRGVVSVGGPLGPGEAERERPLWLLPGYSVGARVGEGSVEALLRRRLGQVLLLLGGVTLVLGAGAWSVWRGVRREMEVARLREGFVSNVSHELRTPLALIRLYAESLATGRVPPDRRQRYYDTLVAETERLSRLVGNVLHFDRFQRDAARLSAERLDAGALAAEIAERYRPVVERGDCTLATDIGQGLWVRADRDALSEALVNLIDNAVKYGGPGEVTLGAAADDGRVVLSVADRGPGVPAADRERVFDPFVRVQPDSADGLVHTAKGTGLGLALVRRIADAHGGRADVQARDGGGALFTLSLPMADAPSPRPAHV